VIYPSGEEHWFYTIKRLIIGKGGKANQILGVSIDITERKQTEIEVMKYRSHLEKLVAERTTIYPTPMSFYSKKLVRYLLNCVQGKTILVTCWSVIMVSACRLNSTGRIRPP